MRALSSQTKELRSKEVPLPTSQQLRAHYVSNAIPMIGFGLVDQTGMYCT